MNLIRLNVDPSKLDLNPEVAINWELYYEQYIKALSFVVVRKNPNINVRFMSFLFLFRHSVELFLKKQSSYLNNTHSLDKLVGNINNLPTCFLEQLSVLRCGGNGEDFRYPTDKKGKPYFNGEVFDVLKSLEYFFNLINVKVNLENKPKGRFEIHSNRFLTIGQVCTDYDFSINILLESIINDELSVNDVYLPLIYLIRHSVELSLKSNLIEAGEEYLTSNQLRNLCNEHSLCKLFENLDTIINKALANMSPKESDFKKETENYHVKLNELKELLNDLDEKSYCYRFPVNEKGEIHELKINTDMLTDLIDLRNNVDSYLNFAVPLLKEYGFL